MADPVREYLNAKRQAAPTGDPVQAYLRARRGGLDIRPAAERPTPPRLPLEFAMRPTEPDVTATARVTPAAPRETPEEPLAVAIPARASTLVEEPREIFAGASALMDPARREQQAETGRARRRQTLRETAHGLSEIGLRLYPGVNTAFAVAEGNPAEAAVSALFDLPYLASVARGLRRGAGAAAQADDPLRVALDEALPPYQPPVGSPAELVDRLPPRMRTGMGQTTIADRPPEVLSPSEAVDRLPVELQTGRGLRPAAPVEAGALGEEGKGALKYLTGLTGAGAGGTAGAATIDPDDSPAERAGKIAAGTVLGGVAGGVAGVAIERAGARLGARGAAPLRAEGPPPAPPRSKLKIVPPGQPAVTEPFRQGPLRRPEANTVKRLDLPADLSERVATVAREFAGPGHESFEAVKARASRLLKTADVPIDFTRGNRAEVLGAAALLKKNTEEAGAIAKRLADPALTDAERTAVAQQLQTLESQSKTLFNSITSAKTEQARDLAANRILANLSNTPEHWQYRAQQAAGRLLTDTEAATIRGYLKAGRRAEMLRYIATLQPSTVTEKLVTAWKAGLLTNPSTHAANITSNTVFQLTEEAARTPAAFWDWVITKVSGGARTKTPTNALIVKASARGAVTGLREAGQRIRGLPTGEALAAGDIPRLTSMGHPILTRVFNAPFAALDAADRPFFQAALQGSLAEQATLLAQSEKLTGKALKTRAGWLLSNPTDEMVGRALHDAAVRTFKDKTALGEVLGAVGRKGGLIGQVVVPFSMTPGAVATRFAESTPYGFLKGGLLWRQAVREAVDGLPNPLLKQQAAETFGRATVGLAPIALGAILYSQGKASGQTDVGDATGRATRRMLSIPDDAFRIGDRWLEFNRLGPQGMLMSLGAVMAQQLEREEGGLSERVGQAAFAGLRTVTDQPFLQGIENLSRARESTTGAGQYLARLGASAVPAGVAALARTVDPTMREARTFGEQVQARVPWWSQALPPQRTAFGEERGRMSPGVQNLVSPVRVTPIPEEINDQLLSEVARVGARISQPTRQPGETGQAYSDRLAQVGAAVRRNVLVVIGSQRYRNPAPAGLLRKHPEWAGLAPEELQRAYQAELIEDAVRAERGSQTRRARSAAQQQQR